MEESEKSIGKKKLPSVLSNFITLLQLQERWMKEQERKLKGKGKGKEKENEQPQREQEDKGKQVEGRVNDEVAGRDTLKNGRFRRYGRDDGKRVAEGKLMEEEVAVDFAVNGSEDVEKEKKGEELKNEKKKKKKKWKKKTKNKKEANASSGNEGEEVVGPAVNAPPPASVENNKGEEEVIGDEFYAPKQASAPIPRTDGRVVEIERRFRAMSMKGEIRTGDRRRYMRRNGNFIHRGGNMELNRRDYYGMFDRRREQNQRTEGKVWVKKGEVSDGKIFGIQSSSCSSKELD